MSKRFTLPRLPYAEDALAPVISAQTLSFHHGKHHKTYVDTLNNLLVDTEFEDAPLEAIIARAAGQADRTAIFNNAAQAWNHTFYWHSLTPKAGKPRGALADKISAASAATTASRRNWRVLPPDSSAADGRGWSWKAMR